MPEPEFQQECRRWTEALCRYLFEGLAPGSPVFLSVDDEVLDRIAGELGRPRGDFVEVVRRRWVRCTRRVWEAEGRTRVALEADTLRIAGDCGEHVTFLAAMVLAAQWMETEVLEDAAPAGKARWAVVIDESNYFQRLRQVLGLELEREHGRPEGLRHYEDERVWIWWNGWLRARGWQPTARPGKKGSPHRYINYPLSQTMLRDGDRQRLARWLWQEAQEDRRLRALDHDGLLGWVLAHQSRLHLPRLWQILERRQDRLRFDATVDAAFEVYASIDWDEEPSAPPAGVPRPVRRLTAGLYREEDPFLGEVCYSYYVPQPADATGTDLAVWLEGDSIRLRPDRVGWFSPLPWPRTPAPPEESRTLRLEGHATIREVVFPGRDFWILVPDPLGGGGAHATWGPPAPEQPFILLCRPRLSPLLDSLRDTGAVEWQASQVEHLGQWFEIRGCRVFPSGWRVRRAGLESSGEALLRELRPRAGGAIRFTGGLPAPDRREGWMQNYLPSVRVQTGPGRAWVRVTDLQSQSEVLREQVFAGEEVSLPASLRPGFYRVEAGREDGEEDTPPQALPPRILAVREWDNLECAVCAKVGPAGVRE
jgi:hypothetical protein